MAQENFAAALKLVLKHEGGYVDHPLDPGGATNRGITRATLEAVRGRPVSKAEVMALSEPEAAAIYRARYWNAVRADELPAGLDLVVFDAAVNSGPARAARWLQMVVGMPADGLIGARTISAARNRPAGDVIAAFTRERLGFLQRLTGWRTFGRGWKRRVRDTEIAALALAGPGAFNPHSPRHKDNLAMTDTKSILSSKTLWANLIGLAAVLMPLFGLDISGVDGAGLSQAMSQAVAAMSFVASSVFRVMASKRITAS